MVEKRKRTMSMEKSLININSIETSGVISKEKLNKEHFFVSLLKKLWSTGLLTKAELQSIQLQILDLFKDQSESRD